MIKGMRDEQKEPAFIGHCVVVVVCRPFPHDYAETSLSYSFLQNYSYSYVFQYSSRVCLHCAIVGTKLYVCVALRFAGFHHALTSIDLVFLGEQYYRYCCTNLTQRRSCVFYLLRILLGFHYVRVYR